MKFKGLVIVILAMLVFLPQARAKQLKEWTSKTTVWEETNGWVYAVGQAEYHHTTTDEFLISQKKATELAVDFLKTYLKVDTIKGFQIIDFEYSPSTYYVLAAAPKSLNNIVKTTNPPPPPPVPNIPPPKETSGLETALVALGVKNYPDIPYDWWQNFSLTDPGQNTFIHNGWIYAIGMGKPNPKIHGDTGQKAAIAVAQRNIATVVGTVYQQSTAPGNYEIKVKGIVKGAELVKTKKFTGSNPMIMVLIRLPLQNF